LQYFTGVQGNFRSFNYEDFNHSSTGYLNNLDYTICFRKEQGFCTITFAPNQDLSNQQIPSISSFNVTANNEDIRPEEAGVGPYECPTDYIVINDLRLCGSRLNPQLYPDTPNPTINSEVLGNLQNFNDLIFFTKILKSMYFYRQ
jgi:hypothetical protein